MRLFVATHNAHKIREISEILPGFEVVADDPEGVEENAPDFAGNALIKVRAIASRHAGEWCMADDSGLEVTALGGAPGVRSARYAGEPSDTPRNNALLLKNLEGVADRRANFTCAVALVAPDGSEHSVEGKCFGRIAEEPSGAAGFGYDPLFIPDGYDKSFAELSAGEKNAISHRGRALEKAKDIISSITNHEPPTTNHESRTTNHAPWLDLFRIVNLPTVPGDVLVGVAAMMYGAVCSAGVSCALSLRSVVAAVVASCFAYLYGLVDNDIVGAKTDGGERPIPRGDISVGAARVVRGLLWGAVLVVGALGRLPPGWWVEMLLLFGAMIVYNRTKWSVVMGLCRGQNVALGSAVVLASMPEGSECAAIMPCAAVMAVWTAYIWAVTKFSSGEEANPAKRATVGFLVGAIIYLQLGALVYFALKAPSPTMRGLLVAGAAMLVLLRILKSIFPKVSAS